MYDELGPDGRRKHTVQQIADEFGVTRPTIYRHLQRPLAEHQLTGRHARRGDVELRGDVLDDLAWTSPRSARNVPTKRTVASCTAKPSRL